MSPGYTELLFVILYNITALYHNASIFSKSSNLKDIGKKIFYFRYL